ncbi:HVO_0649 family zinc finger protein [Natrinema sp. HArc-T2]|uniref:HVO_0649 family zinc finger protein n=1 Tax=Natrinema sp. HArc-T2 TaxID=3242701 RepID=UPI00359CFE83
MVPFNADASTPLEWARQRYEHTDKKCPDCGYVDEEGNWESRTDGRRIVYRHVCPSCGASREHVFTLK